MEVILFGRGSESLLADFDSAGISYERWVPRPWQIMNAGFWARVDKDVAKLALAQVLALWVRNSDSRKILITQGEGKIIDIEGMNVEQVETILPLCRNLMASDKQKLDEKGDAK